MKKLVILFSFLLFAYCSTRSEGYNIKIQIKGAENKSIILAYYFEDKFVTVQELTLDSKGLGVFKGDKKLDGGVYLVSVSDKGYFDFLMVDDQDFSMITDTTNYVKNMKIKNCEENEIFYTHQKKIEEISIKLDNQNKEKEAATDSSKVKDIEVEISILNNEFNGMWKKTVDAYPKSFFATLLRAMYSFEAKDDPFSYVDFSDDRLIRTPFFYNIIRYHIARNIEAGSAKINEENEKLLKLCTNDTVYQYVATYLLNFYRTFSKVGMNEVFVDIAEKHFLNGNANWLDTAAVNLVKRQTEVFKSANIGAKAYDFNVLTTKGDSVSVLSLKTKFTFLFYWSMGCGHCELAADALKINYNDLKNIDIDIFGVNNDAKNIDEWKKYIEKQGYNWNNGIDTNQVSRYREYYYVCSTPLLYVIDDKGLIVNKMVGEVQIQDFLKFVIKK